MALRFFQTRELHKQQCIVGIAELKVIFRMQSGTVSQSSVDQEGKNQSGMRELLREYCENATVHGLKYTSPESGRGVWRR